MLLVGSVDQHDGGILFQFSLLPYRERMTNEEALLLRPMQF